MGKRATLVVNQLAGRMVEMLPHINPDGSPGGLVATDVVVPPGLNVPFDSMIGPGAELKPEDSVPAGTIIARGGRSYPNVVHPAP